MVLLSQIVPLMGILLRTATVWSTLTMVKVDNRQRRFIATFPPSPSKTPPPLAEANGIDLWFDSDNGQLYVYYQDTDSSQWVAITVSTSILDGSIDTLKETTNDSVTVP